MSGSPKYVSPSLTAAIRATIEQARRNEAIIEVSLRRERSSAWLREQELARRHSVLDLATQLEQDLIRQRETLEPADDIAITDEISRARELVNAAAQPDLSNVEAMLILARRRLGEASRRAAHLREERRSAELEGFTGRIAALDKRLDALVDDVDSRLEKSALQGAREALVQARRTASGSDATLADFHIRMAGRAIDLLELQVQEDAQRRQKAQQAARAELLAWDAGLAGLEADPTVMRWLPGEIAGLRERSAQLHERFTGGDYALLSGLAEAIDRHETDIVRRANAAQIKAGQRDYILRGIRETLEGMGFMLGVVEEEVPGHPATALRFSAVNEAGRGISVSVPVDGEVYYDIDGYAKSTESKVGGGTAAVCDEAEEVLNEMHGLLEEGFQVRMGELMWEGKDPDRILRQADELPRSGEQDREDRR